MRIQQAKDLRSKGWTPDAIRKMRAAANRSAMGKGNALDDLDAEANAGSLQDAQRALNQKQIQAMGFNGKTTQKLSQIVDAQANQFDDLSGKFQGLEAFVDQIAQKVQMSQQSTQRANQSGHSNSRGSTAQKPGRFTSCPSEIQMRLSGALRESRLGTAPRTSNEIIEQCRAMIRLGVTDGEIRRNLSTKTGLARQTIAKYITVARKRNLEYLGTSNDENLSSSLAYWNSKKQRAERELAQVERDEQAANAKIQDEDDPDSLQALAKISEGIRKRRYTQEQNSFRAQSEIDRLLGNHAPLRVDTRNANVDVSKWTGPELEEKMRQIGLQTNLSVAPLLETLPLGSVPPNSGEQTSGRSI